MSKYYKKAIDILETATGEEVRVLMVSIAKSHPSILVKAAEGGDGGRPVTFKSRIQEKYVVYGKVEAIKLARQIKGWGLIGAKEWVEENCTP